MAFPEVPFRGSLLSSPRVSRDSVVSFILPLLILTMRLLPQPSSVPLSADAQRARPLGSIQVCVENPHMEPGFSLAVTGKRGSSCSVSLSAGLRFIWWRCLRRAPSRAACPGLARGHRLWLRSPLSCRLTPRPRRAEGGSPRCLPRAHTSVQRQRLRVRERTQTVSGDR